MPMITLEVSDELAIKLIPLRQQLPELLAQVVALADQPAPEPRQVKIHAEAEAWRAMPLAMCQTYTGQFVAVHDANAVPLTLSNHYDECTMNQSFAW